MSVEEDIRAFKTWASRMGFPTKAIPTAKALKDVFKSPQRNVFCNLMRRVRPIEEVKAIKEVILINKMNKLKHTILTVADRKTLPRELQIYLKKQDLEKALQEAQDTLTEKKNQYEQLMSSMKMKCIRMMNINQKLEKLEAKVILYEKKAKQLDGELCKEQDIRERIKVNTPVILNEQNNSRAMAEEAVLEAIEKLKEFYDSCEKETNQQCLHDCKQKLWSNMREIFQNIPNLNIFKVLLRLKDKQLEDLLLIFKEVEDNNLPHQYHEVETALRWNILEKQAELLQLIQRYTAVHKERCRVEQELINKYDNFEEKLLEKMSFLNQIYDTTKRENLIREFIVQYTKQNALKNCVTYLQKETETIKRNSEVLNDQLEDHELLLGSLKDTYQNINATVNRMHQEMQQLSQVRERLIFTRDAAKQEFLDLKNILNDNRKALRRNLQRSLIARPNNDPFRINHNSVLCSTKLDLDLTGTSMKSVQLNRSSRHLPGNSSDLMTTLRSTNAGGSQIILPRHRTELQIFADLNLEQCSIIPKECQMYVSVNPLVVGTRELTSTLLLAPGIFLTPAGVLQEVRKQLEWSEYLENRMYNNKLQVDVNPIDTVALRQIAREHDDQVNNSFDRIQHVLNKIHYSLEKNEKLYNFLLANPLRHLIPNEKKYRNRTYRDYEQEFMLYYRMLPTD